jgi:two-component system, NtrC family, sensor histidine kinase KinB
MKHGVRLQTRFLWAGCLLIAATIGSSIWSALTFRRLTTVVNATLSESQETVDLCSELHSSLEREDDALLLFLAGDVEQARRALDDERRRGDEGYERLVGRLQESDAEEKGIAGELRRQIGRYRVAGDALIHASRPSDGLERYHGQVNPLLRRAVAACDRLREANFRSMQQAGIRARDEAARGTRLVTAISALTVLLGVSVAVWLARTILVPVKELTQSVEAIRHGNFDRRVDYAAGDELGQLAAGFNRMAEAIAQYRRSSLGELLTAKTTLEATLNALPDAVLVFAPDASLAALNPPAKRILAAQGVAALDCLADIPFPDENRTRIELALDGVNPPQPEFDFSRTLNVELDGQVRRFILTTIPIPEFQSGQFGVVVVLDDVTEFVRLDELRSELIGVASHELNSPLTSLRMNLLMLAEEASPLSSRQQQLLDAAVGGCNELGWTIDELLDVTRIEAGQLRLNLSPVELVPLVESVVKSMQTRFEDARVHIQLDSGNYSQAALRVLADRPRLASVMANVLGNALKYSPTGGLVDIRFSSVQNAHAGGAPTVQIAVSDQGPGIPKEYRERIFEKFFRVEHYLERRENKVRGTGIGLYLCREILKAHRGGIVCETNPNELGTLFVIKLPAAF